MVHKLSPLFRNWSCPWHSGWSYWSGTGRPAQRHPQWHLSVSRWCDKSDKESHARTNSALSERTPWYTEQGMSDKTCVSTANSLVFGICPNKWNIWSHCRLIHVLPLTQFSLKTFPTQDFPFLRLDTLVELPFFLWLFRLVLAVFGKSLPARLAIGTPCSSPGPISPQHSKLFSCD